MPSWVVPVLGIVLAGGLGGTILAVLRGVDLTRGRTARTEAQGIGYLRRTMLEAEYGQQVATHRMEYYRDELNPHLRNRVADLEFIVRTELGKDRVPAWAPAPDMRPLPQRPLELQKGDPDGRADATPGADGQAD